MFHELFDGQQGLPFHLFLIDAETYNSHFHPEMEISFVLNGQAEFHVDERVYPLYQHDYLVAKPLVLHRINSCTPDCRLLILQIDLSAFQIYDPTGALERFVFTNSVNNRNGKLYQTLYQSYREMLRLGVEQKPNWKLDMLRETATIISAFAENAQSNPGGRSQASLSLDDSGRERIREVLAWLDRHWQESFTMEMLAREMHMSPSGFSRFFKGAMKTGFQKYLTDLRLNRSLHLLTDSSTPIIDIAVGCGFNDYKTYSRLFKNAYGMSPGSYRKSAEKKPAELPADNSITSEHVLSSIPPSFGEAQGRVLQVLELRPAELTARNIAMRYGAVLSVGPAPALTLGAIQEQLLYASGLLCTRYVQLQLDPFAFGEAGLTGAFYGAFPDEIFRFLSEHSLLPVLCFAPFQRESCPFDAVSSFLSALRRGYLAVSRPIPLAFRLWDLPELPSHPMYREPGSFFALIRNTVLKIRELFPNAQLIAPATCGADRFSFFTQFLSKCAQHRISFEDYVYSACGLLDPHDRSIPPELAPSVSLSEGKSSDSSLKGALTSMARALKKAGFPQQILVSGWPMSDGGQDYTRDTAAVPPRMLRELTPVLSICRGIVCDLSDRKWGRPLDESAEFGGGSGVMTQLGIPKPAFSLLRFIRFLGEECLETGDHYILNRSQGGLQLLLYHSSPYSEEYLSRQQSLLFEEDRYNIYEQHSEREFSIRMTIPAGNYSVISYTLNRNNASPYDEWIRMGSPRDNFLQYADYLKGRSYPGIHTERHIVKGELHLDCTLPVHSVVLVLITPV